MGLEIRTNAILGKKKFQGQLHLDSKTLSFRGPDLKWEQQLCGQFTVFERAGVLHFQSGREKIAFEVGKTTNTWVEKILNPPDRLKKLGIKPNTSVWLSTGFDKRFRDELKAIGVKVIRKIEKCHVAFWNVASREQLVDFQELVEDLPVGINIWVVWPKGSDAIRQRDVMETTKAHGFGPSKTASFDATHSSMRYAKKK